MVFQNVLAYSVIIIIITGNIHHNLTRTGCYFVKKDMVPRVFIDSCFLPTSTVPTQSLNEGENS